MKTALVKLSALFLLMLVPSMLRAADDAAAPSTNPSDSPTTQPEKEHHKSSGANKFYGVISAVDTKAKTITIDDQTYVITDQTAMTKAADGTAATLADATVGEPARGSFHKAEDGTMNVTKVRFGKKTGGSKGGKGKKHTATSQPDAA